VSPLRKTGRGGWKAADVDQLIDEHIDMLARLGLKVRVVASSRKRVA
jgi:hypothetical protein